MPDHRGKERQKFTKIAAKNRRSGKFSVSYSDIFQMAGIRSILYPFRWLGCAWTGWNWPHFGTKHGALYRTFAIFASENLTISPKSWKMEDVWIYREFSAKNSTTDWKKTPNTEVRLAREAPNFEVRSSRFTRSRPLLRAQTTYLSEKLTLSVLVSNCFRRYICFSQNYIVKCSPTSKQWSWTTSSAVLNYHISTMRMREETKKGEKFGAELTFKA